MGALEGFVEELIGIDEGGGDGLAEGAGGIAFVLGGEELAAFGVEEGDNDGEFGGGVVGDDVEGGDADEFAASSLRQSAGDGDGDAEAGETAGAEGEVEVVDVLGGPALGLGKVADGGHEFDGVALVGGELAAGEEVGAEGDGDGAEAAGGFDSEDAGEGGHKR